MDASHILFVTHDAGRALRLTPTGIEAQWQTSQNRSQADRQGIVAGLRAHGGTDEQQVAAAIEAELSQV